MPDRYETLDTVGSGGQAVVYRARDRRLGREVALKELRNGLLRDDDAKRRFEREAEALARLHHPAIVHVYDFGVDSDVPFLVMSYVEGKSLRDRLKRCGDIGQGLVFSLGKRLTSALSHVHEEGVLHRDLKPENVLLKDGKIENAVVADFGIAHLLERTTTATRIGTPEYMSPEQLEGKPLDERSDVYGLGAVLYECVTGDPPYGRGGMPQIIYRIVQEERVPVREAAPSVLKELEHIIERCLSEKRTDRYESATAVEEAFQREEGAQWKIMQYTENLAEDIELRTREMKSSLDQYQ